MTFFAWGVEGEEIITVVGQTTGTRSLRQHVGVEKVKDGEGVENAGVVVIEGEGVGVLVILIILLITSWDKL